MINSVSLTGRLTKDVDLKYSQSGKAYAAFILAVNRKFTNQQGQREADFIRCKAFGKTAEVLANYTNKGSLVGVEGNIQTGSFDGQDGQRVFTTDIIAQSITLLGSNDNQQQQTNQNSNTGFNQQPQPNQQNYTNTTNNPFASNDGPIEITDDDLPF